MWQLDPPDGGFVGAIPTEYIKRARKYMPTPTVAHGQALFWAGPAGGFQGCTELEANERCQDQWLREVQAEFRHGALSETNHAFMHGEETVVPGSWTGGVAQCKNVMCQMLGDVAMQACEAARSSKRADDKYKALVSRKECGICKKERRSKVMVASGSNDRKFQNEQFAVAPAVFANNDVKYETNKRRAAEFAHTSGKRLVHIIAKDVPGTETLRQRPNIATEKLKWLQRHDRESRDLYGVLPICLHET